MIKQELEISILTLNIYTSYYMPNTPIYIFIYYQN